MVMQPSNINFTRPTFRFNTLASRAASQQAAVLNEMKGLVPYASIQHGGLH
jgi:hypothetical protein